MRVQDYEYNENSEGKVSQKRGEELINAIELEIRKNSVPHFKILRIGKNDEEYEFLYNYLEEKGIDIRGINITMEEIEGYEEVSKQGANYYDLPEVIEPEKEKALFEKLNKIKEEKLKQGIDYLKDDEYKDVRRQIAEGNLRLAKYITTFKPFRKVNIEQDDLFSFGYRGLNDAIDKFDHTMGYKFSTYAWRAIYRRIERGIANEYGINQNQYLEYREVQDTRQMFVEEMDREPSPEELSDILGFSSKKINDLMNIDKVMINFDSFEENVYEENIEEVIDNHHDSGKVVKIGEEYYEEGILIEGETKDKATDWDANVQHEAEINALKNKMIKTLKTLTPKEAKVLMFRFGIKDGTPLTYEEVAEKFNLTRERIKQIEAKAIRKMRHPSRSKDIEGF